MQPLFTEQAFQIVVKALMNETNGPDDEQQAADVAAINNTPAIGAMTGVVDDHLFAVGGIPLINFMAADINALQPIWPDIWRAIVALSRGFWEQVNPSQAFPTIRFPQPDITEDTLVVQITSKITLDWGHN